MMIGEVAINNMNN